MPGTQTQEEADITDIDEMLSQIEGAKPEVEDKPKPGKPLDDDDPVLIRATHPQHINIKSDDMGVETTPIPDGGGGPDAVTSTTSDFEKLRTQIWQLITEDRAMLDEYIEIFSDKLKGDDGKAYHIQAITTLCSTKAMLSMQSTRLLDSMTKMLGVIKNIKTVSGGEGPDLSDLLEQSPTTGGLDPMKP